MAKIALISQSTDDASWGLATCLHQQRQDVIFISSRQEDPWRGGSFEFITPFKKWSTLEALKTFGVLLQWNPDVLHFVFSKPEDRPTRAHWVLASAFTAVPGKVVAVSSFSELNFRKKIDLLFLKLARLSTFATRSHLMSAKRNLNTPQITEVFPPMETLASADPGHRAPAKIRTELEALVKTLGRYVVFPQPPGRPELIDCFREKGLEVLTLSESFNNRSWYYNSGPVSPQERSYLIQKSKAVFLAGMNLSILELKLYQDLALRHHRPILVTPDQLETLPGLCWHGKSGWVLDQGLGSLQTLLAQNSYLNLGGYQAPSSDELLDSNLNDLLRLYNRAMSLET